MATYATPLPQSPRSEVLEWRFPRPHHQYVLTGRSRAAWQTSFVVPQLDLLLDAGLCVNRLRPRHVFVTHGHSDHTQLAPAFARREDEPDVFCPAAVRDALDDFIRASVHLNLGGVLELPEARELSTDEKNRVGSARTAPGRTHISYGLEAGDEVPLRRLRCGTTVVTAQAFECDHSVPCLGYLFSVTTQRLRPEHAGLRGEEIRAIRQRGEAVTEAHKVPLFAFLGDTTAATLAAAPDWLAAGIPVVVTECSFLLDEHADAAERTRHTLWRDLEPVVRRWPRTIFVLTHFSLRYRDADIRRFFREMADPPTNIVVWVDGED